MKPFACVVLLSMVAGAAMGCGKPVLPTAGPQTNEGFAAHVLREIVRAEKDWKYQDLDRNGRNDFWTRDLSGLFALDSTAMAGARGVSREVAMSDPASMAHYPSLRKGGSAPVHGYRFRAMLMDERGWPYALDEDEDGKADTNSERFGFLAYPEPYGAGGRYVMIVNEKETIWEKDLGGGLPPDRFPVDPAREGWAPRERAGGRGE